MVVMMERPPAASSLRISTQCIAVVESRPAQYLYAFSAPHNSIPLNSHSEYLQAQFCLVLK